MAILNSTYLDFVGNQLATPHQFATLASATGRSQDHQVQIAQGVLGDLFSYQGQQATVSVATEQLIVVGLTLERVTDPTSLLSENWATRQAALADQSAVWATYGTSQADFTETQQAVATLLDIPFVPTPSGYISKPADRTIWLTLDATQFQTLFGASLLTVSGKEEYLAWAGNLDLAASIPHVEGIWFETGASLTNPAVLDKQGVSIPEGPLGIGNASPDAAITIATPAAIAANYNFPLSASVATPSIALVEQLVADQAALFAALNDYRQAVGLPLMSQSQFIVVSGIDPTAPSSGELTLDISVLTDVAPNSTQYLYSFLWGTPFNAFQQAFFDNVNDPGILSSSYGIDVQPTAASPFQRALQGLFVDGALSNVSVHMAAGDQGSSANLGNGIANYEAALSPTYGLAVGGTSIASYYSAANDQTLQPLWTLAMENDPATVFQLVAAGLRVLPTNLPTGAPSDPSPTLVSMFESVWQSNAMDAYTAYPGQLASAFGMNQTGLGGVNTALPVPDYQSDFGLTPTSSSGIGRGTPDVSALSGGDTSYAVLNAAYVTDNSQDLTVPNGGTSAASPLWASLTAQLNAAFADQHLFAAPSQRLGYYNDLLYMAAAITPASFNDITLGNNANSFYLVQDQTGYLQISGTAPDVDFTPMVPTGHGYEASASYDLASGLGTPNGMVLARTLTAIAQAQKYSTAPSVIAHDPGPYNAISAADQTLLVQSTYLSTVSLQISGGTVQTFGANDALGWTGRLAGQALQGVIFEADLVTLFDGAGKSMPVEMSVLNGATLGVTHSGGLLPLYQEDYTAKFGFVQFGDVGGMVVLARPVAIAQNAQGQNGQEAILRLRQDGTDSLQLEVYRVDDLNGTIDGIQPGQSNYVTKAGTRNYHTDTGATRIDGPGYGNYKQVTIENVNQNDILAMKLTNKTTGDVFWAYSQANQSPGDSGVTHIYSYGMNIWGFEDQAGGGDQDYNDLIVGIDFTSASAMHDWLV